MLMRETTGEGLDWCEHHEGEAVPLMASDSCSWLTGVKPVVAYLLSAVRKMLFVFEFLKISCRL